jgi:arylsulfatase
MPADSEDKGPSERTSKPSDHNALSRRNILLAGTSLAAATAINTVDRTQVAQAQPILPPQAMAPSGRKPNILVIWGDDVGVANISAYSNGLMGYETPSIDRIGLEQIYSRKRQAYRRLDLPLGMRRVRRADIQGLVIGPCEVQSYAM